MQNLFRNALIAFTALAASSCSTVSTGGAGSATVPANRSTELGFIAVATKQGSCSQPQKPKMTLLSAPSHGNVQFKWRHGEVEKFKSRCPNGVMGMAIIYTPERGYRGPDSFAFGVSYVAFQGGSPNNRSHSTERVVLEVK